VVIAINVQKGEFMRTIVLFLLLLWPSLAMAGVVNVEFKFTPFVGDPVKADQVETVAGKALVFVNNVMIAEKDVEKREVPVLFAEREISAPVWLPVQSLGPALRKGKNVIRIEFKPTDTAVSYHAQLRWALVTDQVTRTEDAPGSVRETNQSGEGVDEKRGTGRMVFERQFAAEFAADLPWHHYPPITALSDGEKKDLALLVKERAAAFKPDFSAVYRLLGGNPNINLAELKKGACLDKGYGAGIRIASQPADQLDFVVTGNPEVVVQGKGGSLFQPVDPNAFERITDDTMQMCIGMALSMLYPPRLVVVRTPAGQWEVVY
jgi:hypothetical protein